MYQHKSASLHAIIVAAGFHANENGLSSLAPLLPCLNNFMSTTRCSRAIFPNQPQTPTMLERCVIERDQFHAFVIIKDLNLKLTGEENYVPSRMTTIMSLAHKWLPIGRSNPPSYASLPNDLEARIWDLRH